MTVKETYLKYYCKMCDNFIEFNLTGHIFTYKKMVKCNKCNKGCIKVLSIPVTYDTKEEEMLKRERAEYRRELGLNLVEKSFRE